jgi:carbon-monoxide dehydrogenase medium subunit
VAGRAAFLSCAPTPTVLDLTPALGGDVYDLVAGSLDPTDDIHATAPYRRHLAATLAGRGVARALARARESAEVPA